MSGSAPLTDQPRSSAFESENIADNLHDWQDIMASAMLPLTMIPSLGHVFRGSVVTRRLSGLVVARIEAEPHELHRSRCNENAQAMRFFNLTLQLSGTSTLEQDGRLCTLQQGDLVVFDAANSYHRVFPTPYATLVLMIPEPALGLAPQAIRAVTARTVSGTIGLGRVLSEFLRGVSENLDELSGAAGVRIARSIVELVAAVLVQRLNASTSVRDMHARSLRDSVLLYIDEHYADPGCNRETVAAEHFLSARHLHNLFSPEGDSISGLIRQRRLDAARTMLADPTQDWLSVAGIAARCGFSNGNSFARAFRASFGVTPREFRADRAAGIGTAGSGTLRA